MSRAKSIKKVVEKVVHTRLRVNIPAGKATSAAPLGQQLGQIGVNIAAFCKDFNARTENIREGVPLPVRVTVNPDRSYNLTINSPVSTYLIKQAAGAQKGVMQAGRETGGWITLKHVYEIAKVKSLEPNLELHSLEQICNMIIGSARSCGIKVVRDYDPEEYGEFLKQRAEIVEQQKQELEKIRQDKLLRK